MSDYHINVFYSDSDESWIADVPDLQLLGPRPDGRGRPARSHDCEGALALRALGSTGTPSPKPRYRPALYAAG